MFKKGNNFDRVKQRFSLRKLNIGVCSVLLGLTFMSGNNNTVKAETTQNPTKHEESKATDQSQTPLYPSAILPENEVEFIENEIDKILSELPEKLGFVLPGGSVAASQAHVCRTVCRRAERCVLRLAQEATVGEEILQFLNRLSDFFFVLAKKMNIIDGNSEKIWQKPCN